MIHSAPQKLTVQVRRKAEPAKKLVKEWVTDWRDARNVAQEVSYKRITGGSYTFTCLNLLSRL